MATTLDLDHVSLFVRDLDTSARFYSEVLGLPEIEKKTARVNVRWFGLDPGRAIHLILGLQRFQRADRGPPTLPLRRRASTRPFGTWPTVESRFRTFRAHSGRFRSDLTVSGRCTFRTRMVTGLRSTMLYLSNSILIAKSVKSACNPRLLLTPGVLLLL